MREILEEKGRTLDIVLQENAAFAREWFWDDRALTSLTQNINLRMVWNLIIDCQKYYDDVMLHYVIFLVHRMCKDCAYEPFEYWYHRFMHLLENVDVRCCVWDIPAAHVSHSPSDGLTFFFPKQGNLPTRINFWYKMHRSVFRASNLESALESFFCSMCPPKHVLQEPDAIMPVVAEGLCFAFKHKYNFLLDFGDGITYWFHKVPGASGKGLFYAVELHYFFSSLQASAPQARTSETLVCLPREGATVILPEQMPFSVNVCHEELNLLPYDKHIHGVMAMCLRARNLSSFVVPKKGGHVLSFAQYMRLLESNLGLDAGSGPQVSSHFFLFFSDTCEEGLTVRYKHGTWHMAGEVKKSVVSDVLFF